MSDQWAVGSGETERVRPGWWWLAGLSSQYRLGRLGEKLWLCSAVWSGPTHWYLTLRPDNTLFTLQQRDGAGGTSSRHQETSNTLLGIFPQRDLLRLLPVLQEHQVGGQQQQGQLQECPLQAEQLLQLWRSGHRGRQCTGWSRQRRIPGRIVVICSPLVH